MSLFSNLLRFLSSSKQTARRAQPRKLANESLEGRKMLAGDVVDGDYCEPTAEVVAEDQQANPAGAPVIQRFIGEQVGGDSRTVHWRFTGRVVDNGNVSDLTVTFSGLLDDAESVETRADGSFILLTTLPRNSWGLAKATVVDDMGNTSPVALSYITP